MTTKYHNKSKTQLAMSVNSHPPSFACPLTMEVMGDPVMDKCAHNFERKAILEWLNTGHSCCPISRKPLTQADLVPNHTLAERVERWMWQKEQCEIDWENEDCSETVATDTDGIQDEDVEIGHHKPKKFGHHKPKKFGSKQKRRAHYETVPADFILLPQERHVLQMVRSRNEEADRKVRRGECCATVTRIIAVAVSLVLLGIGVARMIR
jgi:hypothetical protein